MRKKTIVVLLIALLVAGAAFAADYLIGGRWLAEGSGYAEKVVRVSLNAAGTLDISSTVQDGVESITGYDIWCELTASKLGINAWSYRQNQVLSTPIPIKDFNPSMSDPFRLPAFTIDGLTYTVVLTSVSSGTVEIRGDVDIDGVGTCRVSADCVIWKEGTPRPNVSDSDSGCNTGFGVSALFILVFSCTLLNGKSRRHTLS